MRHWISTAAVALTLTAATTSSALPPNERGRGFREGANHHLGDDSFAAAFGRLPGANDGEAGRMKTHLVHARAWLASRPATRPELTATRERMLGYLDDYIAKGITPLNTHLPWRSPVFIDDAGAVCAVGYLIERSAGRPLAEAIAAAHRYELLEDIAARMPDVKSWTEASGFTLEELASIQPGYSAPEASTWHAWDLAAKPLPDGPAPTDESDVLRGTIRKGNMDGTWARLDANSNVVGSGALSAGAGSWQSFYPSGAKMAEGAYVHNRPDGAWRFFHPSGGLAAEGRFDRGDRAGFWQFFQDKPTRMVIAEGNFARARIAGTWRHFDATGHLLAVSSEHTPALWQGSFGGYLLDVFPDSSGVHHWVHQGNLGGDHHRLDMFFDGSEVLYLQKDRAFDAQGNSLTKVDGAWRTSACKWNRARMHAAGVGDIVTLHGLVFRDEEGRCGEARAVSAARAKHLEAMLGSMDRVRSLSPDFVKKVVLSQHTAPGESLDEDSDEGKAAKDLAKVLAANMTWYVEWPHVEGRFMALFQTLPGYGHSI